jgi:ring-1,2-phenylacetyl-CoA epoxidase subunit PaaC
VIALASELRATVLALADDEHLIGARHTSWIGTAPFLEEDLAFCSIAQDELGHAIALYELLVDDVDTFALLRQPGEYRSCELVELPCADWAEALVRHVLYDHAETLRWRSLATCGVGEVAAIASWALREEAFHIAHGDALVIRLMRDGRAAGRLTAALQRLAPVAMSLWTPSEPTERIGEWWSGIEPLFGASGIAPSLAAGGANDRGVRSEHFAALHAEIRRVIDLDPTARW